MHRIAGSVGLFGLCTAIRLPDVVDIKHGGHETFAIAQCDRIANTQRFGDSAD